MKPTELKGKVISCVLPKGTSATVVQTLFDNGFTRVNYAYARGFDIHDEPSQKTGIPKAVEKEMLTIIAKDEAEGEKIFDLVFDVANINRLGGGIMYMSSLSGAVPFLLPQIDSGDAPRTMGANPSGTTAPPMAAKPR